MSALEKDKEVWEIAYEKLSYQWSIEYEIPELEAKRRLDLVLRKCPSYLNNFFTPNRPN